MNGIHYEKMHTPLVIKTLGGHCHADMRAPNVTVEIKGLEFLASPIVLKSSTIELILGMDWLKAHIASINCATKVVQLLHPSDEIVNYTARITRDAEAQIYVLNALNASPLEGIENVPVV